MSAPSKASCAAVAHEDVRQSCATARAALTQLRAFPRKGWSSCTKAYAKVVQTSCGRGLGRARRRRRKGR